MCSMKNNMKLQPKVTKTLGNNKAEAWESTGFVCLVNVKKQVVTVFYKNRMSHIH